MRSNLFDNSVPAQAMEYRLPSAGLPYLKKFPEFPETVVISPYTMETEGYLLGVTSTHDKMTFVTGKVTKLPSGFNVNELLIADEFFILAVARALTYGEMYSFRCQCPNCGHLESPQMRVPDELPVKVWDRQSPPVLERRLPCGDLVGFKFMTVREDDQANRYVRELVNKSGDTANVAEGPIGYMRRMAYHVETVNGDPPANIAEADQWVMKLKGPDMVAFTEAINQLGCGIRYDWIIECDKCQYIYERTIPLVGDFFRGNQIRRSLTPSKSRDEAQQPPADGEPAV